MPSVYERRNPQPPRPSLTPSFWALVTTLVCAHASLVMAHALEPALLTVLVWLPAGIACASAVTLARRCAHPRPAMLLVAALTCVACASTCVAAVCGRRMRVCEEVLRTTAVSQWELRVDSDASHATSGYRYRCAVRHNQVRGEVWLVSPAPLARGSLITCVGRFKPLGADDYGRSSWAQGVCGSVRLMRLRSVRESHGLVRGTFAIRQAALAAIQPATSPYRALLAGLVCGSREQLDAYGLTDAFAACGVAHLVAVSGMHLSIIALLVDGVVGMIGLGLTARLVAVGVLTGLFVAFCGAPPSAVRAWCMTLVAAGAHLAGRRTHALSAVSLVGCALVLADPTLSGQLGFLLSVTSVGGLCLFGSYAAWALDAVLGQVRLPRSVSYEVRRRVSKGCGEARRMLAATLVCQLVTLPFAVSAFGRLSLVAPSAGLVVGPLVTPLLMLGVVGIALCLVGCPPDLALAPCDMLARTVIWLVERLASVPFASVALRLSGPLVLGTLVALLVFWYLLWPDMDVRLIRRSLGCVIALVVSLLLWWRLCAPARIVVLDVGQGDAILVQDGAASLLVDAGPDETVAQALSRNHVFHLDAVVLTHMHDDHYGGLAALVGTVPCEEVYVAEGVCASLSPQVAELCTELVGHAPRELSYGDTISVGGFGLTIIWPRMPVDGDTNPDSIELVARYTRAGKTLTALLTGDAEREETGACLAAGDVGDIDLLKVGHHGSQDSLTPDEAHALRPEVAVASAGEGNAYGHPDPLCVSVLEACGARFLCTMDEGDVEVRPGRTGPVVRCQHACPSRGTESGGVS